MKKESEFHDLKGKTLSIIIISKDKTEVEFRTTQGDIFKMYHEQDCCENVSVEDIIGDLDDLIGYEILEAEEATNRKTNPDGVEVSEYQDSFTWTFYKLSTIKGSVTIRWYGESNGYYSESVTFCAL